MIDLTRRLVLGSLIAGTFTGLSAPVLAKVSNRYQGLIQLQRDLYGATDLLYSELKKFDESEDRRLGVDGVRIISAAAARDKFAGGRQLRKELVEAVAINPKAEALFSYMVAEFNRDNLEDETTAMLLRGKIRQLFNGEISIDIMSEQELARTEDSIVCIAIAKHLLSSKKVPLNSQVVPSFHLFATRYRGLIL